MGCVVMASNGVYMIRPGVLYRELGGEMILLDSGSGQYFSLNQTGTRVWELLRTGTTVEGICAALARLYNMPEKQAMSDLVPFLEDLAGTGLIHPGLHDDPG
jgi:hypothetical protein